MTEIDAFVCIRVIKAPRIRLTAGASAACVWIGAGASVSKIKTTSTLAMGFGEERAEVPLHEIRVNVAEVILERQCPRIPGDRVQVGVSPYDPTHGFVTFRLREGQNAPR